MTDLHQSARGKAEASEEEIRGDESCRGPPLSREHNFAQKSSLSKAPDPSTRRSVEHSVRFSMPDHLYVAVYRLGQISFGLATAAPHYICESTRRAREDSRDRAGRTIPVGQRSLARNLEQCTIREQGIASRNESSDLRYRVGAPYAAEWVCICYGTYPYRRIRLTVAKQTSFSSTVTRDEALNALAMAVNISVLLRAIDFDILAAPVLYLSVRARYHLGLAFGAKVTKRSCTLFLAKRIKFRSLRLLHLSLLWTGACCTASCMYDI